MTDLRRLLDTPFAGGTLADASAHALYVARLDPGRANELAAAYRAHETTLRSSLRRMTPYAHSQMRNSATRCKTRSRLTRFRTTRSSATSAGRSGSR